VLSAADEEPVFLRSVSTHANALFYVVSYLLLDSYTINNVNSRVNLLPMITLISRVEIGANIAIYGGILDIEKFHCMIRLSMLDPFTEWT
jgi:hypothetical protein